MSESPFGDRALWWVCCYDCAPDSWDRARGAPGLTVPFGHPDVPQYPATEKAVAWINAHGDATPHRNIVLLGVKPLPEGHELPTPRYGTVVVLAPEDQTVRLPVGALALTPVNAQGEPVADTIHIGPERGAQLTYTETVLRPQVLRANKEDPER